MKWIDTHVHIGRFHNTRYLAGDLAPLWKEGVAEAWCSSLSGAKVGMRYGNDEMRAAMAVEPRLKGLVWVNPNDPDWKSLTHSYLDSGFIGLKLHPPLDWWEPTEAMLVPIFEVAAERGVPIFLHAHGLHLLEGTLALFPSVPLVIYHMGGFEGIALARAHPNVWLETSGCNAATIFAGVQSVGPERILYGTDAPFRMVPNGIGLTPAGPFMTYRNRGLADLAEAVPDAKARKKILRENPERLLKRDEMIPPQQPPFQAAAISTRA